MPSTHQTINYGTVLPQDDDVLYEVVDNQIVELGPMVAHEIWLATALARHLGNFAIPHQLGRVVQELLFDFTAMVKRKRRLDVALCHERWPRQRPVPHAEAWEGYRTRWGSDQSLGWGTTFWTRLPSTLDWGRVRLGHFYFPGEQNL